MRDVYIRGNGIDNIIDNSISTIKYIKIYL